MRTVRGQQGLSLIELAIVVAIIGILAAIVIPSYLNLTQNAQAASEDGVIGALASAAVIYLAKNGAFPADPETLGTQVTPRVTDLDRLTGVPNIAHTVSYNPATGWISATLTGNHPTSHTHRRAASVAGLPKGRTTYAALQSEKRG